VNEEQYYQISRKSWELERNDSLQKVISSNCVANIGDCEKCSAVLVKKTDILIHSKEYSLQRRTMFESRPYHPYPKGKVAESRGKGRTLNLMIKAEENYALLGCV
jgi:hypothetical protein